MGRFFVALTVCLLMPVYSGPELRDAHCEGLPGSNFVLCCAKNEMGDRVCENMTAFDCGSYGGRKVYDCSECKPAD